MAIHVTTRHGPDFDLLTEIIDPAKSPYAVSVKNYVQKVREFYAVLGVNCALWTAAWEPEFLEPDKPVEYLLELSEERVIAYVDEETWSPFLFGKRPDFQYSRMPVRYKFTSVLVPPPIRRDEVKEFRRYCSTKTGHCKLEERKSGVDLQRLLRAFAGDEKGAGVVGRRSFSIGETL